MEMLLRGSFGPCEEGLCEEGVLRVWGGLRAKFGQVLPCLVEFFVLGLMMGSFFGTGESRMGGDRVYGMGEVWVVEFVQAFP